MKFPYLIFTFFLLFSLGCESNTSQTGTIEDKITDALPSDFLPFYDKFHADSNYQIEHITFPMTGTSATLDSTQTNKNFTWKREDWKFQKGINLGDIYVREFVQISEDIIFENIKHKDVKYMMQRRFAIISDEWHLIHYIEMSPYK